MELQTFKHEQFGDLRIMDEDGVVWFIGKDVAAILGYSDTAAAIKRHVDDEDKLTRRFVEAPGGKIIQTLGNFRSPAFYP